MQDFLIDGSFERQLWQMVTPTAHIVAATATNRRRPTFLIAVAAIAATVVAGGVVLWREPGASPPPLGPAPSAWKTTMEMRPGQEGWIGLFEFPARGTEPVFITSARFLDVPSGLRVLDITAVPTASGRLGGSRERPSQLYPVTDAFFVPGKDNEWYFIAHLRAERAGTFTTGDLELGWRTTTRHGTVSFPYRIGVYPPASPPTSS